MGSAKSVGRTIGIMLLLQFLAGSLANFVLVHPVFSPPGFLVNAANSALQLGVSALLLLATGALSVGIAITALPLFRQYSHAMSFWFLALAVVGLSLAAVESSTLLSLLTLSQAYARADAADETLFQTLRVVVASSRNWAHYIHLFLGGTMYLVLYGLLYRFVLIPRALAAFGLVAVLLQLITVGMPLFGYRVVMSLLIPTALSYLALALWLAARGFDERHQPFPAGSPAAPG